MARQFNGSSDYLLSASALTLGAPTLVSISFWLWWDTFADDGKLCFDYGHGAAANTGWYAQPNGNSAGGGTFQIGARGVGSSDNQLRGFTRPSAGAWHHYILNFDWAQTVDFVLRSVYVDASSVTLGTEVFSGTVTGTEADLALGVMAYNNGTSLFGAGRMADVAIWTGINLNGTDATALNGGTLPTSVQSGNRIYYWKTCGTAAPEPPTTGAVNLTVNGSSQTAHPSAISASCGPGVVYAPGKRMVGVSYHQG